MSLDILMAAAATHLLSALTAPCSHIQNNGGAQECLGVGQNGGADQVIGDKRTTNPNDKSSVAEPANYPWEWVQSIDYPKTALLQSAEGTTRITLVVGLDGKPTECDVDKSSGNKDLDSAACKASLARALFNPARNSAGKPTIGSYSTSVAWRIPNFGPMDVPENERFLQSYIIETDGSVSSCKLFVPSSDSVIPCGFERRFHRPTNANGEPVRKRVMKTTIIKVSDIEDSE